MTLDKKVIGNWGGSVAVRINGLNASQVSGISEGDEVYLEYRRGKIIIRKVAK